MSDKSLGNMKSMAGQAGNGGSGDSIGSAATMRGAVMAARFRAGDLILGRYRIIDELGQGGMGVVYRCFDDVGGIEVALKALPPVVSHNSGEMEEVRENFRLVEKLHHPNIAGIKTLERDSASGDYYLIMECVEGMDLRQWARKRRSNGRALAVDEVLTVAHYIATALDYAHEQQIIHRDIKPGNVRVTFGDEVKVLDFGLAAQLHSSMQRVSRAYGGTSGTGPYMAPEQWRGRRQDARADQYALAATVYELLSGAPPFESHDIAVLREAALHETPQLLSDVPQHVNAALARALAKEPGERFRSCSEFVQALRGEGSAVPGAPTADRGHDVIGKKRAKKTTLWLALAVGLAAASTVSIRSISSYNARIAQERQAEFGLTNDDLQQVQVPTFDEAFDPDDELHKQQSLTLDEVFGPSEMPKQQARWLTVDEAFGPSEAPDDSAQVQTSFTVDEIFMQAATVNLANGVKLELVWCPADSFTMGSPAREVGRYDDETQHRVTLTKGFWIGKYEVTQGQWEAVMGSNPSHFKNASQSAPVEGVSWNDCQEFVRQLNARVVGGGFRLPTEAEWEYACRAGTTTTFHYGGSLDASMANFNGNYPYGGGRTDRYRQRTVAVGSFRPNDLGLHDMHGNVWEWCQDWYSTYPSGSVTDPVGPGSGSVRICRGGCWSDDSRFCRTAFRGRLPPGLRDCDLGLRLARDSQ